MAVVKHAGQTGAVAERKLGDSMLRHLLKKVKCQRKSSQHFCVKHFRGFGITTNGPASSPTQTQLQIYTYGLL